MQQNKFVYASDKIKCILNSYYSITIFQDFNVMFKIKEIRTFQNGYVYAKFLVLYLVTKFCNKIYFFFLTFYFNIIVFLFCYTGSKIIV